MVSVRALAADFGRRHVSRDPAASRAPMEGPPHRDGARIEVDVVPAQRHGIRAAEPPSGNEVHRDLPCRTGSEAPQGLHVLGLQRDAVLGARRAVADLHGAAPGSVGVHEADCGCCFQHAGEDGSGFLDTTTATCAGDAVELEMRRLHLAQRHVADGGDDVALDDRAVTGESTLTPRRELRWPTVSGRGRWPSGARGCRTGLTATPGPTGVSPGVQRGNRTGVGWSENADRRMVRGRTVVGVTGCAVRPRSTDRRRESRTGGRRWI